ncbi:MAG: hypothetical protein M3114_08125 [Thermoproteota archaeon]|nr:hypothetical protein [Thermoproteota archaeon]
MVSTEKRNYHVIHDIIGVDPQVGPNELEYFHTEKLARPANLIVDARSNVGNNTGLFHMYRRITGSNYVANKK